MALSFHSQQLIVITRPDFYADEVSQISQLLLADSRFLLHLRKPEGSADDYGRVLSLLPQDQLGRVTLGDHFELADSFPVGGVHLGGRQPVYAGKRRLRVSKSCHSLEELADIDRFSYVFLSPIFNSISKQGYNAAFGHTDLLRASQQGLVNSRVIALGGVDAQTLPLLKPYSFGGAAVLGAVWNHFSVERFKALAGLF